MAVSEREEVGVERNGHAATVTLRRPRALNAISLRMALELMSALRDLAYDPETWVVVLAAEGEKAFCAGADLHERRGAAPQDLAARRDAFRALFEVVRDVPQPTIAALFGYVLGAGLELALSCDVAVAASDAVLGLPEGRVGLVPGGGGTYHLSRILGPARAKELIFTGRRLTADEALAAGLVSHVVPRAELAAEVERLTEEILVSSPVATRLAKRAVRAAGADELAAALAAEDAALAEAGRSADAAEGVRAFSERRRPRWINR